MLALRLDSVYQWQRNQTTVAKMWLIGAVPYKSRDSNGFGTHFWQVQPVTGQ